MQTRDGRDRVGKTEPATAAAAWCAGCHGSAIPGQVRAAGLVASRAIKVRPAQQQRGQQRRWQQQQQMQRAGVGWQR
jgi:hypothetical protein